MSHEGGGVEPARRTTALAWIRRIATAAAVVSLAAFFWTEGGRLAAMVRPSPGFLALCAAGSLVSLTSYAQCYVWMLRRAGVHVGFGEYFALAVLAQAVNLMAPLRGGVAIVPAYLREKKGLGLIRFVGIAAAFHVQIILTMAFVATGVLGWMAVARGRREVLPMIGVAAAVLVGGVASLSVAFRFGTTILKKLRMDSGRVSEALGAMRSALSDPAAVARLAPILLLNVAGSSISLYSAFHALGFDHDLLEAIAVRSTSTLAAAIPITPSDIGVYEAAVALVGRRLAIDPVASVTAALIGRGALALLLVALSLPASYVVHVRGARD